MEWSYWKVIFEVGAWIYLSAKKLALQGICYEGRVYAAGSPSGGTKYVRHQSESAILSARLSMSME